MNFSNNVGDLQRSQSVQSPVTTSKASQADASKQAATVPGSRQVDEAKLTSTAGALLESMSGSDTRTERVEAIQKAIAANTYNIPASAVADKLIESMLR